MIYSESSKYDMQNVYEFNLENDNNKIYYCNEPVQVGKMERDWLNNLKTEIAQTSEYKHNVIVNLTWFKANWDEFEPLRILVANLGSIEHIKIWFVGSVDGNYWITYPWIEPYHYFLKLNYKISFVGYADEHWHSWYPEWFISNNLKLDVNKIMLNSEPKYHYLSYNRKPRIHREWLIKSIIENNLLDKGWVTFEKGHFIEIDNLSANTDQEKHSVDNRFSRPEDITSLGDLNIWRDSYLIIVSETDHDDAWQISEKTWKPIFGLRPFLINGSKNLYNIIDKLGFYTPRDLFKNINLDCNYETVVNQIKNLYDKKPIELFELWQDQFEMLLHNRKRMFEIANSDPTKILNWPQAKNKNQYPVAPVFA